MRSDNEKFTVLIVPRSMRNPWSQSFLVICSAMIAACALPNPGSMLVRNPEKFPESTAFIATPNLVFISVVISCFGSDVVVRKL